MVTDASPSDRIRIRAKELGFSHVGIARADPLERERVYLDGWLAQERHSTMKYLERQPERRTDPSAVLPGARSVIVVASNYFVPGRQSDDADAGKVSRYAWGSDYHDVLREPLRELERFVTELMPEERTRGYIDTGPVMEKAWAVRGGIGWLGKHTNVITRDAGSWVFLGVIITTAALECDTPVEDRCGTCTRCIDACPTQAIPAPYELDASRCISYLTIEYKGADHGDAASLPFQRWIFGCDICQDVCPWNRFEKPSAVQAFQPRAAALSARFDWILAMSDDDFQTAFGGTPVMRAKRAGLQRNVRTVLSQNASYTNATDTDH